MTISVGHRIIAGFGIVIFLTFGLGWYQLTNIKAMTDLSVRIVDNDLEILRLLRQLGNARRDQTIAYERAWSTYFLKRSGIDGTDPVVFQTEWNLINERMRGIINQVDAMAVAQKKLATTEARVQLLEQLHTNAQARVQILDETTMTAHALFDLMKSNDLAQYSSLNRVLSGLREDALEQGVKAEELTSSLAINAKRSILDLDAALHRTSLLALGVVTIIASVIAVTIFRSISSPLQGFMRFVERIGSGDLTKTLDRVGGDEIGRLGGHLNGMVVNLNDIAKQTRAATDNLNSAAAEMQASVQQQASGVNEQNAAIQQITSTLSEITRSGSQISERAKAVASAAEAAAAASKSGLQAVNETSRLMNAIRDQAEKVAGNVVALTEKTQSVGAIIATVNDLSERSNLLALNAAIEAAAAGEHGQSFAVVADEIKNLAGQAKEATAEVRAILSDIQHGIGAAVMQTEEAVKRVESGKQQATATEQTINNLMRSVEQSVATFEQIVAATNQQQVGIEQVTQSIHGIREASEQMAVGTKDVGRVASSVAALSNQLQRVVERYQV